MIELIKMHEFLDCPPVFCESPGWKMPFILQSPSGVKGFVAEFMEGPTAFMAEAENRMLSSLPFGLRILGQVFLLLFVSVFRPGSLVKGVFMAALLILLSAMWFVP